MSNYANIVPKMTSEKEGKVDPNYYNYLTEKLDYGEPNVVVDSVVKLMTNDFRFQPENIRIADFGCFTGSVINRVYLSLPELLKKKTSFYGFDNDEAMVKEAALMRPYITFNYYNITEYPPIIDTF